ncbi:MAG TPA: flagellar assembly peptidoglycan hydrolase FlgJ [Pseudomonadales bacterium]|nr:flagellar assembly peptidoglycan hydrolase FlgJ [Pseudomonadales bacterium]
MDNSIAGAAKPLAGFAYSDISKLGLIKAQGPAGIRAAAQQFESMFIDMVMSSMRQATESFEAGDYTSSDATRMQQEMLDHQWAIHIAEHGGVGLADVIVKQLGGDTTKGSAAAKSGGLSIGASAASGSTPGAQTTDAPNATAAIADPTSAADAASGDLVSVNSPEAALEALATVLASIPPEPAPQVPPGIAAAPPDAVVRQSADGTDDDALTVTAMGTKDSAFDDPDDFVAKVLPVLQRALAGTGLNPLMVLAQGALETGWGAHVIHSPSGDSTHNLFNIKASSDWDGPSVDVSTVEVRGGQAIQQRDRFRSYGSVEDAARDYAALLQGDQRYQRALDAAQDPAKFADELQKAGYATDPNYAAKIVRVLTSGPLRAGAANFGVK